MKLLRLLLCMVMAVNICAETSSAYIFEYQNENMTICFESALDEKTCKAISDHLAYGVSDNEISRISFCWLFGHDLTVSPVTVIKHKVKPYAPRCLKEEHDVTTCSKCDYMEDEIISSVYIPCHPEE